MDSISVPRVITNRMITLISNCQCEVLVALSALNGYIIEPVIAEATTAWRAILFCSELGHQRVKLEGDAL
jgi:hypothetical protein